MVFTLYSEVLCYESCNVYATVSCLRVVAVLEVERGHAVQPGLSQLGRGAVRIGQRVMKINQLLMIYLVNLHVVS